MDIKKPSMDMKGGLCKPGTTPQNSTISHIFLADMKGKMGDMKMGDMKKMMGDMDPEKMKQKMASMGEEQKAKFKEKMMKMAMETVSQVS